MSLMGTIASPATQLIVALSHDATTLEIYGGESGWTLSTSGPKCQQKKKK